MFPLPMNGIAGYPWHFIKVPQHIMLLSTLNVMKQGTLNVKCRAQGTTLYHSQGLSLDLLIWYGLSSGVTRSLHLCQRSLSSFKNDWKKRDRFHSEWEAKKSLSTPFPPPPLVKRMVGLWNVDYVKAMIHISFKSGKSRLQF